MEKSVKRNLLIVSGLLLAAGIVAYLYSQNSKDKSEPVLDPEKQPDIKITSTDKPIVTNNSNVKPKPPAQGIKIQTAQAKLVKANDVLAANINGANTKAVYALTDGVGVYNMNNVLSFKTKKNQYLGIVSQARKSNNDYIINFIGNGGVKYWITSSYAGIKVN